ncbi:MAG TPA: DMT family transporter, partial [Candidatus Lustribacter sp.]|nr:DMT family transporter [Candidatus Lustribacter sp.]
MTISLIWGSSFLLIKLALDAFTPLQVATGRILTGTAAVAVMAWATGARPPRERRVWAHLMVSAFFLCTLPFLLFPLGEERISSALAGIGNATTPLAAVVFTGLMIPADRLSARKLVAVGVGFLGVVVIMSPWQTQGRPDLLGFSMTVVAGASYGLGWTYVKRFLSSSDLGGLSLPAAQLSVASVQVSLALVLTWLVAPGGRGAPWSPAVPAGHSLRPALLALLMLGVVGTGVAYNLQFDLVRAVGPQIATTITYLIPIVAVLLGIAFLDERLTSWQLAGAGIVLVAAVVIGLPGRRR